MKILSQDSSFQSRIDEPKNGIIPGWLISIEPFVYPILLVNGQNATLLRWPIQRPDVNDALGLSGDYGFEFEYKNLQPGDVIELFVFQDDIMKCLAQVISTDVSYRPSIFRQIDVAKSLSKSPECVAITCWDGGHNPIGRAYVLYQIIRSQRPAVLLAYSFDEFSSELWKPLQNTYFNYILIPWRDRFEYLEYMDLHALKFNTIWMCKPRLPTFELTAYISDSESKIILDHDDNESYFSSRTKIDSFYGPNTTSVSNYLTSKVTAHTCASQSLANLYSGKVVRHARENFKNSPPNLDTTNLIKIGFIGTIRPHKGLLEAAKAIKLAAWSLQLQIEFHVYGDFAPKTIKKELENFGVITLENVDLTQLNNKLQELDIILTGFPTNNISDAEINKYQISSKIGDALANGRPALVPMSASTMDLEHAPGVYLFDKDTFSEVLLRILANLNPVSLPDEFTYEGAYKSFVEAEKAATAKPIEINLLHHKKNLVLERKRIVLVWKQHDSGLYGRRIDQIARIFSLLDDNLDIIIMELWHKTTSQDHREQSNQFSSESRHLSYLLDMKLHSTIKTNNRIYYKSILYTSSESLDLEFLKFMNRNEISAANTIFVLFPIIRFLEKILPIISEFLIVSDFVDNQFSWASGETAARYASQYYQLAKSAKLLIFNSHDNLSYFRDAKFLEGVDEDKITVIPNWYCEPPNNSAHVVKLSDRRKENAQFLFSGNLNDRVDWDLLRDLASLREDVFIHIVGNGRRVSEHLQALWPYKNIVYWGPMPEAKVRDLAELCCAGLVPHKLDDKSKFMNPLKIQMYANLNLPVISMDVPGIVKTKHISICSTPQQFIAAAIKCADRCVSKSKYVSKNYSKSSSQSTDGVEYYRRIVGLWGDVH